MSIQEVLHHALSNNGELKALRQEQDIYEARKAKAETFINPVLEVEGESGSSSGRVHNKNYTVGISQEFLTGGKRGQRLRAADHESESFRWVVADRERLLREEVMTAYNAVVLSRKRIELADKYIDLTRQTLSAVSDQFAAGDIAELDVTLVKVELAEKEKSRLDAVNDLETAKSRLAVLCGMQEGIDVAAEFVQMRIGAANEELQNNALSSRPDLKLLDSEKMRNDAEAELARAERIPNITAGIYAKRDTTGEEQVVYGENAWFYTSRQDSRTNYIGLKLSVPLPLFDRNSSGIQEADARRSSAETKLSYRRKTIANEVSAAYKSVKSAERALSIYSKDILRQTEENLEAIRSGYQLGEFDVFTLLNEQKKNYEITEKFLSSLCNHSNALIKLESAAGIHSESIQSGGVQ